MILRDAARKYFLTSKIFGKIWSKLKTNYNYFKRNPALCVIIHISIIAIIMATNSDVNDASVDNKLMDSPMGRTSTDENTPTATETVGHSEKGVNDASVDIKPMDSLMERTSADEVTPTATENVGHPEKAVNDASADIKLMDGPMERTSAEEDTPTATENVGHSEKAVNDIGQHGLANEEPERILTAISLLSSYNLEFNSHGKLVDECGEDFDFNEFASATDNQRRYEEIGKIVEMYVYGLLETKLQRKYLQADKSGTFIFVSEGYESCEKLLVLIHGTGVVRAGQWARRLIINDNLDSGTQMPYIEKALKQGWGVIVTNTNDRHHTEGARHPSDHGLYVWEHYIKEHKSIKKIAIVAHSAGGGVTSSMLAANEKDFMDRVYAIAFTDSFGSASWRTEEYFNKVTRNWVTSSRTINTELHGRGMKCMSAGTDKHEETSHYAIVYVFKFIEERFKDKHPGAVPDLAKAGGSKREADKTSKASKSTEDDNHDPHSSNEQGAGDIEMHGGKVGENGDSSSTDKCRPAEGEKLEASAQMEVETKDDEAVDDPAKDVGTETQMDTDAEVTGNSKAEPSVDEHLPTGSADGEIPKPSVDEHLPAGSADGEIPEPSVDEHLPAGSADGEIPEKAQHIDSKDGNCDGSISEGATPEVCEQLIHNRERDDGDHMTSGDAVAALTDGVADQPANDVIVETYMGTQQESVPETQQTEMSPPIATDSTFPTTAMNIADDDTSDSTSEIEMSNDDGLPMASEETHKDPENVEVPSKGTTDSQRFPAELSDTEAPLTPHSGGAEEYPPNSTCAAEPLVVWWTTPTATAVFVLLAVCLFTQLYTYYNW